MDKLEEKEVQGLLAEACGTGRTDVVNQLLGKGLISVNAPLFWHASSPPLAPTNQLDTRNNQQNPNKNSDKDPEGVTIETRALHIASQESQVDCLRALLKSGADPSLRDEAGRLAYEISTKVSRQVFHQELLQSVASGDLDKVKALLEGKVSPNCRDGTEGEGSPLHWAASFGQGKEMMQLLIRYGAEVDRTNRKGQAALHEACENAHVVSIKALVQLGATVDLEDNEGKTPLDTVRRPADRDKVQAALQAIETDSQDASTESNQIVNKASKVVDLDEVTALRRLNEEKDMTIIALRETVETLLEKEGVLKYIAKLQEEYRTLSAQTQRIEDHREHLQSMYSKCDSELDKALRENAELRDALHEKEQKVLELLEQEQSRSEVAPSIATATIKEQQHSEKEHPTPALLERSRSSSMEKRESVDLIVMERNRLAQELESERKLRFSEARLHLSYSTQLREQLKAAQTELKALALEQQKRVVVEGLEKVSEELHQTVKNERAQIDDRGFLSSIFHSLFGADDDDSDADEYDDDEDEELEEK